MIRIAKPPKDLDSFFGRKWLESITLQSGDIGALAELPFILLNLNPAYPNSRVLAVGSSLDLINGGIGSTILIDLSDTGVSTGTYNLLDVDEKGRVVSATLEPVIASIDNVDGTITVAVLSGNATVSLNLNHANIWLVDQSVPDDAYGPSWNGNFEIPTKNAVYDKIEGVISLPGSSGQLLYNAAGVFGATSQIAYINSGSAILHLVLQASAANNVPLVTKGFATQSANLQEWQNDAAIVLSAVKATGAILVPDDAYGSTWNANTEVPTKNALYDKLETTIGILSTTTGIDAKTTGATNLYTVPVGKTAIVTGAIIRCITATSITVGPSLGIGVASGEDDIFGSSALTALTTTSSIHGFSTVGASISAAAASIIKVGIDTAATGTSETLAIDLLGYLA